MSVKISPIQAAEAVGLDTFAMANYLREGWFMLGTWDRAWRRWTSEAKIAVGGEDNMFQVEFGLSLLGFFAVGVRVPRALTKGWVHHRREFGVELRGLWPIFFVGYDSQMADMTDYYRRSYLGQGRPLPDYLNRVTLHPGWRLSLVPNLHRWKNWLLGPLVRVEDEIRVYDDVKLALPEGVYLGSVRFFRERVTRPRRLRAYRDEIVGRWSSEHWLVFPGKGENSYDCGDDGIRDHSKLIRRYRNERSLEVDGEDVAKVVAATVAYVLRQRARYGGVNWEPEGMGVMR